MSLIVEQTDVTGGLFDGINVSSIGEYKLRAAQLFDPLRGGQRNLVIFGAALLGQQIAKAAACAGLQVLAFADNDEKLWGTVRDGLYVLSPREAVERFSGLATFVVAIYNPSRPLRQLQELGCEGAASYPEFFWNFGEFMSGITGMAQPERIVENIGDVRTAYGLLEDDVSRREFAAQINWRCTLRRSLLPPPSPFANIYFDPEIFSLSEEEVVVDCGAFNGDTLRTFLQRSVRFKRFYAVEPDADNRTALETYVAGLRPAQRDAVVVLPYAIGSEDSEIPFRAGRGPASGVSELSEFVVSCRRLDSVIETEPTLIKMDIEGEELMGLRGAERLIARARPVLCVVAYHYCEHLWQIPNLIKSILPEYSLYLRRYAEDCWETVYYAIPSGRGSC